MLENENLVTHDQAHKRNKSEDGRQSHRGIGNEKPEHGAGYEQDDGEHAHERQLVLLEVEQQEEENDNHGDKQPRPELRQALLVVLYLAAYFGRDTLRQAHLLLDKPLQAGDEILRRLGAGKFGSHRHAAHTVAVDDFRLAPLGRDFRHLTQLHFCRGSRRLQVDMLEILESRIVPTVVFQHDRHPVIPFPQRRYRTGIDLRHQSEGERLPADAQLRGGYPVQRNLHNRFRLLEVGTHPHQVGIEAHVVHKLPGGMVQGIQFLSVETELQRLEHLGIQLLEFDEGVGEGFREACRVFVHELFRGFVRGGVHDELRVVLSALLRGVGGLKARRGAPFERGDGTHPLIFAQNGIDRIGDFHGLR